MTGPRSLRTRLQHEDLLVVPGAYDALTARLIEEARFEAVYVTGAGFANASFGLADLGLPTLTEVATHVGRIADAVDIPVVVDADTGYGGPLNVARTMRLLERAGAAAVQIEDQVAPKRCGHFSGKAVVRVAEMADRISAAVDARTNEDVLLIARTDALASEGLEPTLDRARQYVAAGADVIFVEALRTQAELAAVPRAVDVPALVNLVEGGRTPPAPAAVLQQWGYRAVLYANTALRVAAKAVQDAMRELRDTGTTEGILDRMLTWSERQRLVRLAELESFDLRHMRSRDGQPGKS